MQRGRKKFLEELSNDPKFDKPIELANNQITLPYQDSAGYNDCISIKPYSGFCFEMLSQAIFGHNHHNGGKFILPASDNEGIQPDLFNYDARVLYESKSCNNRMKLKLQRRQITAYCKWQMSKIKGAYPRINFVIYSHGIDCIIKKKLTKEQFLEKFRENINYAVKMPFAILLQFFLSEEKFITEDGRPLKLNEYDYSEKEGIGRGYGSDPILSISSLFTRKLIKKPLQTLAYIHFNPEDFEIQTGKVEGINLNGTEINPFPIMLINFKDYYGWLRKEKSQLKHFLEQEAAYLSQVPKIGKKIKAKQNVPEKDEEETDEEYEDLF